MPDIPHVLPLRSQPSMTQQRFKLSIAQRLWLAEGIIIISMLLVFITLAFGHHYYQLRAQLENEVLQQMHQVADSHGADLQATVSAALASRPHTATRGVDAASLWSSTGSRLLQPLQTHHALRHLQLRLGQQIMPIPLLPPTTEAVPAWHWAYALLDDIVLRTPVVADGTTVGTLEATLKQAALIDSLIGFLWSNALAIFAAMLTGAGLMWGLNRAFLRPIQALTQFVNTLTLTHQYAQRIPIQGADELSQLGQGINSMLESISQRDAQLQAELAHRKVMEEKLQFLAHFDKGTHLLNRHAFEEHLTAWLSQPDSPAESKALLLLDLDRFKLVNDSFGHGTGDKLLQQVAHRLRGNIAQQDAVFRLGGDEFAILLTAPSMLQVAQVCKRLIQTISAPFIIDDHEIHIGVSIGVAGLRAGVDSKTETVKNADMALYQAKDAGRNTTRFYQMPTERRPSELRSLREALHFAQQQQELEVYYQPVIDTQALKIIGFEALIRWRHPEKGLLTPEQFIPLAEGSGLIISIGTWVIHQAVKQLAKWQAMFDAALFMNVNISSRQLDDDSLPETLKHALHFYQVPAHTLNLEITESMVMRDIEAAQHSLTTLKQLGVGIAIDDFGIGHSSMNYLKHLPVDILKIDKQFIAGIPRDKVDIAIVDALVALAVSLNLKVVAEGVENHIQFEYLQYKLCHHVQGYLFSAALSASQATAFLADFPDSLPALLEKHPPQSMG